jgi:hypothetical protein
MSSVDLAQEQGTGSGGGQVCEARWRDADEPCPVEPGEHVCLRDDVHLIHVCVGCGGMLRVEPAEADPAADETDGPCSHVWSEGRPCPQGVDHRCDRSGVHGTHVCGCWATDTPSPLAVAA